jgi:hypothetical protein
MEPVGVVEATPLLEEAFKVLTVPLDPAEVRPEVLWAAPLEPELFEP